MTPSSPPASASPSCDRVGLTGLNFFPAFAPPRSGGEMRYWHLYTRLARHGFHVSMVSPTFPFVQPETIRHGPHCIEYRIPKTTVHHRLHQALGRVLRQAECSGLVVALAARFHGAFLEQARRAIARSRILILDFPLPVELFVRPDDPNRPLVVYNAYNVESLLHRQMLPGMAGRAMAAWLARSERRLCRLADVIFACSHEDAQALTRIYGLDPTKVYIVPNGVETGSAPALDSQDPRSAQQARASLGLDPDLPAALFVGSGHRPNIEAAHFLIHEVAPAAREVQFVIAGSVCAALRESGVPNVRLLGPFDETQKPVLFRAATLALNPIFSGSGTNLKMLEFLAAGLPVVSTPLGARGLAVRDGEHLCLAHPEAFVSSVLSVSNDPLQRARIGAAGRELVRERYDWNRIAEDAARVLRHKTQRRLLVLNDFPATPARLGGAVRLLNHYRALARQCHVTILTQTQEDGFRRCVPAPGMEEINIPQNGLTRTTSRLLYALLGVAGDDLATFLTGFFNAALRGAVRREARFAGAVVLSHPYMVGLLPRRLRMPLIYESHNVEADLKPQVYGEGWCARRAARLAQRCEKRAWRKASLIAVCSEENAETLRNLYGRAAESAKATILAPNGVDCAAHHAGNDDHRRALKTAAGLDDQFTAVFLGSGHPPNVAAARFVVERLAPAHPDVLFILIGGVCWTWHHSPRPENVLLMYEQDESVKNRLLDLVDVALNPLTAGSGVSLKTLDYLAAGAAVVTTEVGARGVAIENGVSAIVCPLEEFSRRLAELARDPATCRRLGRRGRALAVERYDWSVTSRAFLQAIEPFLSVASRPDREPDAPDQRTAEAP